MITRPRYPAIFAAAIIAFASASLMAQDRGLVVVAKDGTTLTSFKDSEALVIGESAYSQGWPKLDGVKDDVAAVKKLFTEMGFRITLVQDADSKTLTDKINQFLDDYGYDKDSRLIVYYAGHGATLKLDGGRDMGYIVPIDAPSYVKDDKGFKKKAIAMQQFDTWSKQIESRHVLFLFDSCFSGSVFATSRALPGIIDYKMANPVRQFITSGAADETVPDKSIFRRQLEAGLRNGEADTNHDGYVSATELGDFLQTTVVNYSNESQHPQYGKIRDPALDKGDFVFALAKSGSQLAAASPSAKPIVTFTPSYGSLVVNAASAGALYLDGSKLCDLPAGKKANLGNIETGDRSLELRYADGQSEIITASVAEGQAANVSFTHKPAPPKPAAPAIPAGFVFVPGGTFTMGSPANEAGRSDNEFQHQVNLSAFALSATELTQAEYMSFCQATNGHWPDWKESGNKYNIDNGSDGSYKNHAGPGKENRPIVGVSWYDAVAYCNWRSTAEGKRPCYTISGTNVSCDITANGYRLPTEAEWEYAAKGGAAATSLVVNAVYAGNANLDQVAWYSGNSGGQTHPVGQKAANSLGLYDMSGNVWEWCWDWYGNYPNGSQSDPRGPDSGDFRVLRGGGWGGVAAYLRSAARVGDDPSIRAINCGFRLLCPQIGQ
jgi:formylglycine-generating enzyme required for sulfatase activity